MKELINDIKRDRLLNAINTKLNNLSFREEYSHSDGILWVDYDYNSRNIFCVFPCEKTIYLDDAFDRIFNNLDIEIVKLCIISKFNYEGYDFSRTI